MALENRPDETKPVGPPVERAPYQPPGVAWEELFEPAARA
jgi:hypothetical protein